MSSSLIVGTTLFNVVMIEYIPILFFLLIGLLFGLGLPVVGYISSKLTGSNNPDEEKLSPYECGFDAFEDARMQFDVKYFLVAILFIIFDLEIAFLFPWAASLHQIGDIGFYSMIFFLFLLVIGFFYEWKKGAMNWS